MVNFIMARKKKKKGTDIIGTVARNQVPMIMTFDEDHIEYIKEHLGASLEQAYQIYALFGDMGDVDTDPFEE
jgi:hypothetical protein